jgi:hypothetical protein
MAIIVLLLSGEGYAAPKKKIQQQSTAPSVQKSEVSISEYNEIKLLGEFRAGDNIFETLGKLRNIETVKEVRLYGDIVDEFQYQNEDDRKRGNIVDVKTNSDNIAIRIFGSDVGFEGGGYVEEEPFYDKNGNEYYSLRYEQGVSLVGNDIIINGTKFEVSAYLFWSPGIPLVSDKEPLKLANLNIPLMLGSVELRSGGSPELVVNIGKICDSIKAKHPDTRIFNSGGCEVNEKGKFKGFEFIATCTADSCRLNYIAKSIRSKLDDMYTEHLVELRKGDFKDKKDMKEDL